MLDYFAVFLLTVTAILWGVTNSLMKRAAVGIEKCEKPKASFLRNFLAEVKFLVQNWKYLLTYGSNQCGSLVYYYALGYCDLSVAGPLTNTMTFVVTYLADTYFFDKGSRTDIYGKVGLVLICTGVLLCAASSSIISESATGA